MTTPRGTQRRAAAPPAAAGGEPYNILPIHDLLAEHPSLRFPEVRAAAAALRTVGGLRPPPFSQWRADQDLMDWLGAFFGFQRDNVRNQREHLVLLLANAQMRLSSADFSDTLEPRIARQIRKKLLRNYTSWCGFLGRRPSVYIPDGDPRADLLYTGLHLLVWGEAANLRFMPECLCYIYHHMAGELHRILEGFIDTATGRPVNPAVHGENAFLTRVVTPIYDVIRAEAESSRDGKVPHAAWRNYDDMNEYFWRHDVFDRLGWPMEQSRQFFRTPPDRSRVRKTGFVEVRSFWNIYRSFDRLWVMLILYLQAAAIVAWEGAKWPWDDLRSSRGSKSKDTQARVLSIFITWAALRFLQSLLDIGTQFPRAFRDGRTLAVRMVLKAIVAAAWVLAFAVLYKRIWNQRSSNGQWSSAADSRIMSFLYAAAAFVIPEVLAIVLFIVPWVRNALEKTNWKICYALTWWFQSRSFVGRGLREGTFDNVKYSIFWVLLLAVKFAFSYFLQVRPLVKPTKEIYKLSGIQYTWHEFFGQSNRFAVFVLWLPVVLIYLMDIQIWYAIFSSLTGAFVGLFAHLGEIRDMKQLRLRFQFFASAMSFNIMPEEQQVDESFLPSRLRNFWQRLQLRYGFSRSFRKIESNQVEARRFALVWNEILSKFREEDIVSDREVELLELPPELWNVRVIRWPCFLLCNELSLALGQAKEVRGPDRRLWRKICKNDYRRCAVIEVYDSAKHLLLEIIKEGTEEHDIVTQLFSDFDGSMKMEKFTVGYKMTELHNIHTRLVALLGLLKPTKDVTKIVNALQTLYDVVVRDFQAEKRSMEQLRNEGLAQSRPTRLLFVDAVVLPEEENATFYKQVRRMHTILTSRDSMINVPQNLEARRRIAFFSNSLFMNIPRATQVEKMMAFSVLTPYYKEDVLYSKDQLYKENEDGISILYYLKQIYPDEWEYFVERMKREGMSDINELYSEKERLRDLRHWVSYRGQTLSRTVRGMMYNYEALKMLTFLDSASEHDLKTGTRELATMGSSRIGSSRHDGVAGGSGYYSRASSSRALSRASSSVSSLFKGSEYGTVLMKYTYVVACQLYGEQKAKNDPNAFEILELMKNYEALRVAYVDERQVNGNEKEFFSVLVKYDQQLQREVEIYRVKLPGEFKKIGEGKPENQNHALIFTRGDALQTIDMNQDNYFEEALKMRNLLEEFNSYYGIRKPKILGVREHVFTGSVSSLAWFMSAQETSFVTLGQRVLADPLKVRMHYGHPDVFDRLWFLGRGGISKASKTINISEDIFAGFNCTLRGGNVTHHEYIQVGKGRDVGLNQVSMFEAKVASGNGEQTLSRDVYRLGHRLDFFRMLSFFYTTVGFYFNTMMVVLTVYAFVWGRFYLALSGLEDYISKNTSSSNNAALGAVLNQQFVIQLGLFTALPMIIENSLEHGFLTAVWDFMKMQLQFASVFYTFSMGTKTHYYGRTILHGGAKYRATGRGFVVEHKKFAENYRLYAHSHFIKAIELGVILTLYASYGSASGNTLVYILLTLSSWFLVSSWILAPFIFNPSGFDWLKNFNDFEDFLNWIWFQGGISVQSDQSWETWWEDETDHLRTTGLWGCILEILLDLRFFFFQYAIVYRLHIAGQSRSILVYLLSWACILLAFVALVTVAYFRDRYSAKKHIRYRLVQAIIVGGTVAAIVVLLEFTKFQFVDTFTSLLAFLPTGWGIVSIALVFKPYLRRSEMVWKTVVTVARLYDILFGVIVMAPVAVLSWLPGLQEMQTRILFNEAFSRGLHISQIITGKKAHAF
ncbi:callose synthase 12-like [Miscanthus floridulus]|uniref:callose synthase 12-like n=1 Tax=Miscanthus floridulus TaxID=154761 RepID=UPI00345AA55E